MGLHPSEILIGYEKASKKCLELLESLVCYTAGSLQDTSELFKCIKTVVASKQYGNEKLLADLISRACTYALPNDPKKFNMDNVRVQKVLGGSVHDS